MHVPDNRTALAQRAGLVWFSQLSRCCVTKFVLLSTQRSGSTWVIDNLASHEDVLAYTELFLKEGRGVPHWSRDQSHPYWNSHAAQQGTIAPRLFRPFHVFRYLDAIYRPADQGKAVGFKLMYDQLLRYPEIMLYLLLRRVRVIHLFRQNAVAAVVSNLFRAARNNTAHVREGDRVQEVNVTLDVPETCKKIFWFGKKIRIAQALERLLPLPHLDIAYEELAGNAEKFGDLLDFIQVERKALSSQLKKLQGRPLHHSISNIDELEKGLAGTRYHVMLKELY